MAFSKALIPLLAFLVSDITVAEDLSSLSLEQLISVKVRGSTLFDDTVSKSPSSVSIFTQEEIRTLGFSRLSEVLNYVPGFQSFRSDTAALDSHITSRHYGNSIDVLLLINGKRQNLDWTGMTSTGIFDVWLDNVERIEFIRGPGSAIYGSNALTGVINIVTKGNRELKVAAGNNGQQYISAQWDASSGEYSGGGMVRMDNQRGESFVAEDPFSDQVTQISDPYQNKELALEGKAGEISVHARVMRSHGEGFLLAGVVSEDWNKLNTNSQYLNVQHDHAWSNGIDLLSLAYSGKTSFQGISQSSEQPLLLSEGNFVETETGFNQSLRYEDSKNRLLLGWEYRKPTLETSKITTFGAYNIELQQVPEGGRTIKGLFPEWQHFFSEYTSILIASRYDDYSDFGSHNSPRMALIHQLGDIDVVKFMYSEAFRSPTRTELLADLAPYYKGNSDLKPETIKMSEISWVRSQDTSYLSLSVYHALLTDSILSVTSRPLTWINGRDYSWDGAELEWKKHLGNWRLRGTYSQAFRSDIQDNAQSQKLASAIVTYSNTNWDASLFARYEGAQLESLILNESPDYRTLGGRTIFGAQYNYQVAPQLWIYLHSENLTNRFYYAPNDNSSSSTAGVPQPGMSVMFGVVWDG